MFVESQGDLGLMHTSGGQCSLLVLDLNCSIFFPPLPGFSPCEGCENALVSENGGASNIKPHLIDT